MLTLSPLALRLLKASVERCGRRPAQACQQLAGDAKLLFYLTEEAQEGRDAYVRSGDRSSRSSPVARDGGQLGQQVGRRRPAADAARGDRAGRRRHGVRGRRGRGLIWWRVAAALVVALALQVGTNYANDYSDGVRGTDAGSGSGRCGWWRRAGGARGGEAGRAPRVRRRRAGRSGASPSPSDRCCSLVGAARHRRRVVLHRRAEALRLLRLRRAVRVRVLRARRHRRLDVRAARAPHRPVRRGGGSRRPARHRAARHQQPA